MRPLNATNHPAAQVTQWAQLHDSPKAELTVLFIPSDIETWHERAWRILGLCQPGTLQRMGITLQATSTMWGELNSHPLKLWKQRIGETRPVSPCNHPPQVRLPGRVQLEHDESETAHLAAWMGS